MCSVQLRQHISDNLRLQCLYSSHFVSHCTLTCANATDSWSWCAHRLNGSRQKARKTLAVKLTCPTPSQCQAILFTVITWNTELNCICSAVEKHRRLLERWWRSRNVRYVDRIHKVHYFWWKTTGWIYMVWEKTDKKADDLQSRHFVARDLERHVGSVKTKREAKVGHRKTEPTQYLPPSRWTQSQTLLAERRIIPCSTEIHWRLQNYKNKFGC